MHRSIFNDRIALTGSFRTVLLWFLGAFAVTSVAGAWSALQTYRNVQESRKWSLSVNHTLETLDLLDQTVGLVVDLETAGRGFVISGKESFLQPYRHTIPTLENCDYS